MASAHYKQYVRSQEWKAFRERAISHHGSKCAHCGRADRLHVHHVNYSRVGREQLSDVQVLCHDCHAREHGIRV